MAGASTLARHALAETGDTLQTTADGARADFILARAAIITGHPEQAIDGFQKDFGEQQGASAAGVVAYLPGPYA